MTHVPRFPQAREEKTLQRVTGRALSQSAGPRLRGCPTPSPGRAECPVGPLASPEHRHPSRCSATGRPDAPLLAGMQIAPHANCDFRKLPRGCGFEAHSANLNSGFTAPPCQPFSIDRASRRASHIQSSTSSGNVSRASCRLMAVSSAQVGPPTRSPASRSASSIAAATRPNSEVFDCPVSPCGCIAVEANCAPYGVSG